MTSNHVPLILAFKMTFRTTFRMAFRMTLRMTFKPWDFKEDFEGYFKESSRGRFWETRTGTPKGTSEGTSNRTWKGTCCQAQVRSRSGLVWLKTGPRRGLVVKFRSGPGQAWYRSGSDYSSNLILKR